MGSICLGRQLAPDRYVAVQILKQAWAQSPAFVASFTREAYAAAQLSHHHIASIHGFGEEKGVVYFITEFVDGKSSERPGSRSRAARAGKAVALVLQAARGLKYAHDQNMFHRALSPEVLLVDRQGLVKVLDLGLSKTPDAAAAEDAAFTARPKAGTSQAAVRAAGPLDATSTGMSMASPAYLAPSSPKTPRLPVLALTSTRWAARSISCLQAARHSKVKRPSRSSQSSRQNQSFPPMNGSRPFPEHLPRPCSR